MVVEVAVGNGPSDDAADSGVVVMVSRGGGGLGGGGQLGAGQK
jgi:hypothetical protein